ncbi:MAG: hypothetical protein AVDCRST_MAG88-3081, partial [uncultured Thermomicrobiales bacterium]
MSIGERDIQEGFEAYTADGELIGTVRESQADYLHVHHGRLFGQDEYYFPASVVGRIEGRRVHLTLTRSALEGRDWSVRPRGDGAREDRAGLAGGVGVGATAGTTTGTRDLVGDVTEGALAGAETLDQREIVLPVVEERLDITRRPVEVGEVVINREIIAQQRTIPVEVAHEEVRIERRAANREALPEDLRLTGGEALALLTVDRPAIIPIIEEVVEVRKQLLVREELVVTKMRVTEERTVTETVRRTEPVVDATGRLERADETATSIAPTTGMVGAGAADLTPTRGMAPAGGIAPDLTPNRGTTGTGATGVSGATTGGEAALRDEREIVVPLVEEQLDITKRSVELGEVVVSREVTSTEQTVPVEVAHEEVRVERRAASREATADDLRRAGGEGLALLGFGESVIIPIVEETIDVRKRMMIREELVLTKVRISERHDVT